MSPRFDTVAMLDWSASSRPRRGHDSIWLAVRDGDGTRLRNISTRVRAETELLVLTDDCRTQGKRLLIGADFGFGYPAGFAGRLTGRAEALAVWDWLEARITDDARNRHNAREVAARINGRFDGDGPLWGNGTKADIPGLPRLCPALPAGLDRHRLTETAATKGRTRPKPAWQLAGAGSVGLQMLTGLPVLARLRRVTGAAAWPMEPPDAPVVLAEIYPSLMMAEARALAARTGQVIDAAQVTVMAEAVRRLVRENAIDALLEPPAPPETLREEGWILGAGADAFSRGV